MASPPRPSPPLNEPKSCHLLDAGHFELADVVASFGVGVDVAVVVVGAEVVEVGVWVCEEMPDDHQH